MISPCQARLPCPSRRKPSCLAEFGERLRLARLRRRGTTTTVAARCGISRPTLVKVEHGDPSVTFGTYLRVLAIYGLEGDMAAVANDDQLGR